MLLSVLLVVSLFLGCTKSEEVNFYCTERIVTTYLNGMTNESRSVFTYDDSWNLTSNLTYVNGMETNALYYEYNDDATVVTVTQHFNGLVSGGEYQRTYDKDGNLLKELAVENGTVVSSNEYTYDDNGNVLVHILTPNAPTVITNTYTYDKSGNRITYENKTAYPDQGMEFMVLTEYTYDENNILLLEKASANGIETVTEYTYDTTSKTYLGTRYTPDGAVQNYIRMVYDNSGNLLLQEVMDTEKTVVSSTIQSWAGTDGSISKYEQ